MSIIDTHCHLDQPQFDADLAAVLDRAAAVGVTRIIDPGVDLASCRKALDLADRHPEIFVAIGVHPNDCSGFDAGTLAEFTRDGIPSQGSGYRRDRPGLLS